MITTVGEQLAVWNIEIQIQIQIIKKTHKTKLNDRYKSNWQTSNNEIILHFGAFVFSSHRQHFFFYNHTVVNIQ